MRDVWDHYWVGLTLTLLSLVAGNQTAIAQSPLFPSTPLSPSRLSPAIPIIPSLPTTPPPPTATPTPAPTKPAAKPPAPQKKPLPDKFPPNPLEISEPLDPLIPFDYKERALTVEERRELIKAANRLAVIGAQRQQANDTIGAYEAWNQELRYRRVAEVLVQEVQALGRVGDVAWGQNNQQQLRYITKRLDEIRLQTEKPIAQLQRNSDTPPELLNAKSRSQLVEALGFAYQQIRLPKIAASLFEQVLAQARREGDDLKLEATLINLGQLHLGWFNYPSAATVYQELWQRSQTRQDVFNEPLYLSQLVFIYEQKKQPKETIFYLQQSIEFYRKLNDPKPVPALITRIANNQQTLGQLDRAEANYQLAYRAAQAQLQWADAGDALKRLGELYRKNDRLESAEKIYTFLTIVEQQAYNSYGRMDAYDQLGQIQLQQEKYPAAIVTFEQARQIARQLKFREEYFTAQIQKAAEKAGQ